MKCNYFIRTKIMKVKWNVLCIKKILKSLNDVTSTVDPSTDEVVGACGDSLNTLVDIVVATDVPLILHANVSASDMLSSNICAHDSGPLLNVLDDAGDDSDSSIHHTENIVCDNALEPPVNINVSNIPYDPSLNDGAVSTDTGSPNQDGALVVDIGASVEIGHTEDTEDVGVPINVVNITDDVHATMNDGSASPVVDDSLQRKNVSSR